MHFNSPGKLRKHRFSQNTDCNSTQWTLSLQSISLRSATSRTCDMRRTYSNYGDRCFAAAGLKLWNSLPADLRPANISFQWFKRLQKTFLFGCWDRGTLWLTVKAAPHKFSYLHTYKARFHSGSYSQLHDAFLHVCLPTATQTLSLTRTQHTRPWWYLTPAPASPLHSLSSPSLRRHSTGSGCGGCLRIVLLPYWLCDPYQHQSDSLYKSITHFSN